VFSKRLSNRYLMLKVFLPSAADSLGSLDLLTAERCGTRVMLAVELFRARTGVYPESLDELVPGLLPTLPIDPVTGKPYMYRRPAPGADRHTRPYLLYSVGADGVDDGGRHLSNPRLVLQRGKGGRGDFVYNVPRGADEPPEPVEAEPPAPPPP
jgi:hypothetical protein